MTKIKTIWRFDPLPDITVQELAVIVGWIIRSNHQDVFVRAIEGATPNIQRHFKKEEA